MSMDLTEPDAGSDLQSVMLKATFDEANNCWRLNGVKPVSYTHLDVYKRQAMNIPVPAPMNSRMTVTNAVHPCLLYTSRCV